MEIVNGSKFANIVLSEEKWKFLKVASKKLLALIKIMETECFVLFLNKISNDFGSHLNKIIILCPSTLVGSI